MLEAVFFSPLLPAVRISLCRRERNFVVCCILMVDSSPTPYLEVPPKGGRYHFGSGLFVSPLFRIEASYSPCFETTVVLCWEWSTIPKDKWYKRLVLGVVVQVQWPARLELMTSWCTCHQIVQVLSSFESRKTFWFVSGLQRPRWEEVGQDSRQGRTAKPKLTQSRLQSVWTVDNT